MQTIGSRDFAAELKGHPGYILTWAPFHGQTLWNVDDKRAAESGFW